MGIKYERGQQQSPGVQHLGTYCWGWQPKRRCVWSSSILVLSWLASLSCSVVSAMSRCCALVSEITVYSYSMDGHGRTGFMDCCALVQYCLYLTCMSKCMLHECYMHVSCIFNFGRSMQRILYLKMVILIVATLLYYS